MSKILKIPQTYHRISVKGIEFRGNKVMLVKEDNGEWNLPGGGMDHGESINQCLKREIREEMGVSVKKISKYPITAFPLKYKGTPRLILGYEIKLSSHKFRPSEECTEIGFFTKRQLKNLWVFSVTKRELLELL